MANKPHTGYVDYNKYIETTYKEIREAIQAFYDLPKETPEEVRKVIWKALVEGLNLVQNEIIDLGIEVTV
jgi:hypothetical protein